MLEQEVEKFKYAAELDAALAKTQKKFDDVDELGALVVNFSKYNSHIRQNHQEAAAQAVLEKMQSYLPIIEKHFQDPSLENQNFLAILTRINAEIKNELAILSGRVNGYR